MPSKEGEWGEEERVMARLCLHFLMVMKFNTHAVTEAILHSRDKPVRQLVVNNK